MLKVENLRTFNWQSALLAMRNPLSSWAKSDSEFDDNGNVIKIGENDFRLMKTLFKSGTEHRKYLRQIFVSMDITAPFYWWKDFDTYKVGVTADSCSTMHKLTSKPITLDDFSIDDMDLIDDEEDEVSPKDCFINVVADCEMYRQKYLTYRQKAKLNPKKATHYNSCAKRYWRALVQLLPSAYNQKRTITMNYENVFNIIHQRQNHKLSEFHTLCDAFKTLPYVQELLDTLDEKETEQ